ncbi:hypothetical protein KFE25_002712 [Diacronema lutheri]|uniref:Elongator complex protein 6 n=1 Tax=Diacronema lutheri TaxID=2081491 RepID=A0A8J5XNA3_DIALT|nr:hypothetical protein KFE25_002712 [Diacronema lutheri]
MADGRSDVLSECGGAGAEPMLLSSPNASVARSLLFAHAMRRSLAGESVLFLCPSPAALEGAPFANPAHGLQVDTLETEAALSRIHFKYLGSDTLLRQFLAGAHTMRTPPGLLVVDDLAAFLSSGDAHPPAEHAGGAGVYDVAARLQRTLALAVNAADFFARAVRPDGPNTCSLIVAVIERVLPPLGAADTTARKRWFKRRLRIEGPLAGPAAVLLGQYMVADALLGDLARFELGMARRRASGAHGPADGDHLELTLMISP